MDKPNVLLICVDHWPGRLLAAAGHPCIMTPTLDRLAANGVRFANAYSAAPTCIPARRGLMTGLTPQSHGDRVFKEKLEMPDVPTLASTLVDAGYQAYAIGKMHVYPQRDRIGFGDVILNEEGRHHLGLKADDYELYLAHEGYAGQELTHAMCNNDYMTRPWHLPEYLHPTNWTVYEACRMIKRRDPRKPGFWYVSFNFPHPPLAPLAAYFDMYRDADIPEPFIGDWAQDVDALPFNLREKILTRNDECTARDIRRTRQAFYAQCTHIDHQLRLVIGMLREEGLLDNTIIAFTGDHGDMLGNHRLYAKPFFYEDSAKIPLIIIPTAAYEHLGHHQVDDRLVEIRDVMPTLLDMAGVSIPETVEGVSLLRDEQRDHLYGEHFEGERATRMVRTRRHKLVYYAAGNARQLFDLDEDPDEMHDLAADRAHAELLEDLTQLMIPHLYGADLDWLDNGRLIGLPDKPHTPGPNRGLNGQRGWRFM